MLPDWQRQSELILRRERKHEEESCVYYVPAGNGGASRDSFILNRKLERRDSS